MQSKKNFKTVILLALCLVCSVLFGADVKAEGITGIREVKTSSSGTVAAITNDGELWMWGNNEYGQVGNGSTINVNAPVKVMDNVKKVALTDRNSAAIKEDGSLWMWGNNSSGMFGNGTSDSTKVPLKIMDGVKDIAVSDTHYSAIVKEDGTLWTCGYNFAGCLGNGSSFNGSKEPVKILENVSSVVARGSVVAAIKNDGTLWMWGNNEYLQIGNDSSSDVNSPVQILTDVQDVQISWRYTMALKNDGTSWIWGRYPKGMNDGYKYAPLKQADDVQRIIAGPTMAGMIKTDGSLWMAGYLDNGGGIENGIVFEGYTEIMKSVENADIQHNVAAVIQEDGSLWTFGKQIGDGTNEVRREPVEIMGNVKDICLFKVNGGAVIEQDGSLLMWGNNKSGEMGNGTFAVTLTPQDITDKFVVKESLPFKDVSEDSWYYETVKAAYLNKIMTGLNEEYFGPAEKISRAQFAVILHRINGAPEMDYISMFPDVADNMWYTDAIMWCRDKGIIYGYTHNGHFGVADYITREQMATILYRYVINMGKNGNANYALETVFADAQNVSDFARRGLGWAVAEDIIKGKQSEDGRFLYLDPQGTASRAECATIIMRYIQSGI